MHFPPLPCACSFDGPVEGAHLQLALRHALTCLLEHALDSCHTATQPSPPEAAKVQELAGDMPGTLLPLTDPKQASISNIWLL